MESWTVLDQVQPAKDLGIRRPEPLHLLELGLRWPPETFVGWRMRGLANQGFRITAAVLPDPHRVTNPPAEVELVLLPRSNASRRTKLMTLIRHGIPLALRRPARLRALVRASRASAVADGYGWLNACWILHRCISVARLDPDIIHIDWETGAIIYRPLLEAWDKPMVMSCHGAGVMRLPHGVQGPKLRWELPRAFGRADAIHCVARTVAKHAIELGAPPERIRVIRSAVDPSFFSPNSGGEWSGRHAPAEDPKPSSAFRLVAIGHLKPTKGHEYGLLAVAALRDAGVPVRYEIIGEEPTSPMTLPSDLPRLRHAIDDLELTDRVLIRSGVASEGVRDALRDAHALLHPSLSEGLPTVIVEGMSCGLPVIVTDVAGTRELVDDGIEGFVVEPRDPGGMAAAARRLWKEPELRRRMARAARDRVLRDFNLEGRIDEFARLFREVTARS
jgi:glycosyltransferase involved in cell wall biosynthesis